MNKAIRCGNCGSQYAPETRFCVRCGIDLKTGRLFRTETGIDETELDAPAVRQRLAQSLVAQLFPGAFQPAILIVSLLGLGMASLIGGYSLWAFHECEATSATAMMLLAVAINAQAMAWIVTGEFQILVEAISEMGGRMFYYIVLVLLTLGLASYAVMLTLPVEST